MTHPSASEAIFERYLRHELSLEQAADALTELIRERKAGGGDFSDLALRKPAGMSGAAADPARGEALFAEMNRRAAAG